MKIKYFEECFLFDLWWKHYILRINVTKGRPNNSSQCKRGENKTTLSLKYDELCFNMWYYGTE